MNELDENEDTSQNVTPSLAENNIPPPIYFDISSDASDYVCTDDEDIDDTDDEHIVMSSEEKNEVKYLSIFQKYTDNFDEEIMTVESVEELKKLEIIMMERTDKGYYRCKIQHEEFYNECMLAYAKYCKPEMLKMLMHTFSTQKNESLNHAVATLAPKGKDYSQSEALRTRVMLVAAAQIVGHYSLWKRLFSIFDIQLDENLVRHLKMRDLNKGKRQIFQRTKEYKSSRSTNRYAKFAEAHRSQLEDTKTGAKYESGIAVKIAKKNIKAAPKRNPEGTLPSDWKCPYYHSLFCTKTGHKDCRSGDCQMYGRTKEERNEALAFIMEEAITDAVEVNTTKGKSYFFYYKYYSLFLHSTYVSYFILFFHHILISLLFI